MSSTMACSFKFVEYTTNTHKKMLVWLYTNWIQFRFPKLDVQQLDPIWIQFGTYVQKLGSKLDPN